MQVITRIVFSTAIVLFSAQSAWAACGGTTLTWDSDNNNVQWHAAANWNPDNEPDASTEDVVIVSANKVARMTRTRTIGCLEIQSGVLDARAGNTTITITGDYFRNPNQGSLTILAGDTHTFDMAGTADQSFENFDTVNTLTISNTNTVTFTDAFAIRNALNINGATTILKIDGDLTLEAGSTALTIPANTVVEVASGKILTLNEGVTVNGTLKMAAGSTLVIGNGQTLQVNSGGILQLNGSSGSAVTIKAPGAGNSFAMNIAGQINADYFRVDRLDATGMNVTGTIQSMDNGEFHFLASAGYAVTLASGASIPSTFETVGFFDDDAHGNVQSFNASAYTGSSTTVNDWSGGVGGESGDNDPNCGGDPPGCVAWGSQAGTKLNVSDNTASGSPPTTIAESSADTLFATFQFTLNQASTSTDITAATITMSGNASASDISAVKIYKDDGAGTNCVYDSGVDTQVGSNLTLSGSPPTASVTFSGGDLTTASDTDPACFHVVAATTGSASDEKTIQFKIAATGDVTNDQGYDFSDTAGPPVAAGTSTINSSVASNIWQGDAADGRFNRSGNWQGSGFPDSAKTCTVGTSTTHDLLVGNTTTVACLNTTMTNGAVIDYNNTTNVWEVYGALDVQSGVTFNNAASGVMTMKGASNQSMTLTTAFAGNFIIDNSGAASSNIVNVDGDSEITGNLTVTNGVLRVPNGNTLTVLGNITVQTGATLEVLDGGTLQLGDGSTLTVDSGGTINLTGTASADAVVSSNAGSSSYSVTINGTISARYYKFDHLAAAGVTINSGASIDSTNHLQDCTFSHPVNNNTTFLTLNRKVPTDTMDDCVFELNGQAVTGTVSLDLSGIGTGPQTTLTLNAYSGDAAGAGTQTDGTNYVASWAGATNTIDLTQEATGPSTLNAGTTYNMGRFGFQQTQAGTSFVDADITSLKLTMTGTGSSSDISDVKVYYDSDCDGASGTLIGSNTYTGSPPSRTFTFSAGQATVEADTSSPPKRCIYVEYSIASGAVDAKTLGVEIDGSLDVVNDQSYAISASTPPPVNLGTPGTIVGANTTIWTGSTDTDWFTASNWSAGVPTSTKDCEIDDVANDPVINGGSGTAICKSLSIGNGTLTLVNATSAVLELYGNFDNTGTFTQNDGTLRFEGGANQQLISDTAIEALTFDKTSGGVVLLNSTSLTINDLNIPAGSNFEFRVQSGKTLVLPNGLTLPAGTFNIQGSGRLEIGASQSITVSGGTFQTSGTNDAYSQSTTNKGTITRQGGSGTWGFNATSGSVDLTGFIIDRIDTSGLQITGTANLLSLDGGQFTNLTDSASTRVIQLNTTTTLTETTATNVGFGWGAANATNASSCCAPSTAQTYFLVHAAACGGSTLTFDQWFGDFWPGSPDDLDTEDKIQDADDGGSTCQVSIAASASPVAILAFTATGYNGSVSLDWTTGSESNHAGFNVYRSETLIGGYIRVNSELIRNIHNSTIFQGTYRYLDNDVENDKTYYYYIEDVAFNGTTELHGPAFALPNAAAGAAPATGSDTNVDESDPGAEVGPPSNGPIAMPGRLDLGNGVRIIAQTRGSLRLEVVPPAKQFTVATWDASYKAVSIPGYTSTTVEGHPELLERVLLIEVDELAANASVTNSFIFENAVTNHKIQPAPQWVLNGSNVLEPNYVPSASVYATNATSPAAYYELTPAIQEIAGRKYLKVKINPLQYNPVSEDLKSLQRLVLDIGLDGNAWQTSPPVGVTKTTPSSVEGALRIKYNKTGMYELTYEDLDSAGVLGPFDGADISDFRLFFRGVEYPLDIVSSGNFSAGDKIRFYADYFREVEDDYNEIVLTQYDLNGNGSALRVETIDANPTSLAESTIEGSFRRVVAEQDNQALLDRPFADMSDRFFWKMLFAIKGMAPLPGSELNISINTPKLIQDAGHTVRLKLHVRGKGALSVNPVHHVGIYVNNAPFMLGSQTFTENDKPVMLTFDVPANYFIDGTNTVKVQVQGDKVPDGDYDLVNIDRLVVEYDAFHEAHNDLVIVEKPALGQSMVASGFSSSSILAYDVSDSLYLSKYSNMQITTPDAGTTYEAKFGVSAGSSGDLGFRLNVLEEDAFLKPTALMLGRGYNSSLRDAANGADMIILGHSDLIDAAFDLIDHRESQGLRVKTVDIEQIYAEFSNGVKASRAIRDFLLHAYDNWQAPRPKYVLILGDATFDPRDRYGWGLASDFMSVPFERGQFEDFGNDNWFVTRDGGDSLPLMSIGRLPTNNHFQVSTYVEKLIKYESGEKAPTKEASSSMSFVTDKRPLGEKFDFYSNQLAASAKSLKSDIVTSKVDRSTAASDAAVNTDITAEFNNAPLVMTYLGHGAEDRWADSDVFANAHASALTNERLPIVVALNCLNARFYQDDPNAKSLGESLVFNEQGGAIAFWGSTTMTPPTVQVSLHNHFQAEVINAINQHENKFRIGDFMMNSKVALGSSPGHKDTLRSWTLIGDPAMKLAAQAYADAPPEAPKVGGTTPQTGSTGSTGSTDQSSTSSDDGGGFAGCGTIGTGGGGGTRGLYEVLALLAMLILGRRLIFRPNYQS